MPTSTAMRTIRDEHQALASVLRSLLMLLDHYRRERQAPDFGVLRAMLFYIDEFPERLHHPKESELLFPMVRARSREADDALERLDREHAQGERAIRDLQHQLLAYEMLGEPRRDAFEQAARRYAHFYLDHIRLEEEQVLPVAERVLAPDDLATLDRAFATHCDPLVARETDANYRPVFLRILNEAPAPIGLGPVGAAPVRVPAH